MTDGYNASDLKDVRRAARAAKLAEADRRSVVYSLMSSPAGRNWMYDRLVRCHVFSSSFSRDGLLMAFSEGERNIGLQDLTDIMQFAPDQYIQMTREANDRSISADRGHERDRPDSGRSDSGRPDDPVGSVLSDYEPGDELIPGLYRDDSADGSQEAGS